MSGKGDFDINDHAEGIGGYNGGLYVEKGQQQTSTTFGQQVQADATPLPAKSAGAAGTVVESKGLNPNAAEFNADDYTII